MEEDEESNWSLGRLSLPAEGRRSLERLREVNTVEGVEVKLNARKFIKQVVLGCRSEFLELGKGYALDHYKGS